MLEVREITYEELLGRFEEWLSISGEDFILSPYFQLPFFDIYKDEDAVALQFSVNGKAIGYSIVRYADNSIEFPIYEPVTPYFDVVTDNGYRRDVLYALLKDREFRLLPILENSLTLKLLREEFEAGIENHSTIKYMRLPDSLDAIIYRSKKRDRMVKLLKKMGKKKEFYPLRDWNLHDLMLLSGMYLIPHTIQPFLSDLLSITSNAGILRIYCLDEEGCAIVFLYKGKAYLWHMGGPSPMEKDSRNYLFLKVLEETIGEGARELVVLYDEPEDFGMRFSERRTLKVFSG